MTTNVLAEKLRARMAAKQIAAGKNADTSTPMESDAEREARLMDDDSAWNGCSFGGGSRSILPRNSNTTGFHF